MEINKFICNQKHNTYKNISAKIAFVDMHSASPVAIIHSDSI